MIDRRYNPVVVGALLIAWPTLALLHAADRATAAMPLLTWTAMAVAMMVPLTVPAATHVAENSLRRRRNGAVATFLGAFVVVWLMLGGVFFGTASLVAASALRLEPVGGLAATTLLVAALWHVSPIRQRLLRGCQRGVPLSPRGWRATASCVRYGVLYGLRCVGSCWALMLFMTTVRTDHLVWAVGLGASSIADRYVSGLRRRPWALSIGLLGLGAAILFRTPADAPDLVSWLCSIPTR